MKKLLLLNFFIFNLSFSQTITTITPSDYNSSTFTNLDFLKSELEQVKFVGLGEALHFMGETYTAKIKMVKFLHEKCGFDVLAFECPMYNMNILNQQLKEGIANPDSISKNISGVWNTTEMKELFNYIVDSQKTEHPLELVGFDESFFSVKANYNLPKDFSRFIDTLERKSQRSFKLDSSFYNAITETVNRCYGFSKREPADTLLMHHKFRNINEALKSVSYQENTYLNFWKHMVDNLQSVYRKNYGTSDRDKQMGINAEFLGDKLYPKKKIMLWAATTHLLYNTESIEAYRESDRFNKNKMGTYLREQYGNQYYLIAFTPFEGTCGFKGYLGLGKTKVKSKKGSLERFINTYYTSEYAYISFRNSLLAKTFSEQVFKSNITWVDGISYNGDEMDIYNVADGIFYIKSEHLVNQVP
ncbi:erythromycin esterase family protein [Mangrovimonas sp. TPBH4]|uniref:erythromycin esterase family protein n=1 Tax=Mangrovimonas sp. TPBH4 TaxID=1645914 RepID=UPI0006B51F0B|nr:erythromycin esterase family protein [Mangrovimonas sp. TPBH4]